MYSEDSIISKALMIHHAILDHDGFGSITCNDRDGLRLCGRDEDGSAASLVLFQNLPADPSGRDSDIRKNACSSRLSATLQMMTWVYPPLLYARPVPRRSCRGISYDGSNYSPRSALRDSTTEGVALRTRSRCQPAPVVLIRVKHRARGYISSLCVVPGVGVYPHPRATSSPPASDPENSQRCAFIAPSFAADTFAHAASCLRTTVQPLARYVTRPSQHSTLALDSPQPPPRRCDEILGAPVPAALEYIPIPIPIPSSFAPRDPGAGQDISQERISVVYQLPTVSTLAIRCGSVHINNAPLADRGPKMD
ncbi:hypothetical protein B0H14DRAFT_1139032 [Mycena olivaceomarginata]|nr:hypothetical protein B0H14DRAFT_1139032 [Mycena olivaceomarginata]